MRPTTGGSSDDDEARLTFYSVGDAARLFGMAEMTLYRAIHSGEFPAVRIRDRLFVPARAIDAMVDAAICGGLVNATGWVPGQAHDPAGTHQHTNTSTDDGRSSKCADRPRPGANQTGAGSPSTQQGAQEVPS